MHSTTTVAALALAAFLGAIGFAPPAWSEDLNIDFTAGRGAALTSDGAASGQTGTWNVVSSAAPVTLQDLTGAATGVQLAESPSSLNQGGTGAAPAHPMMGDNFYLFGSGSTYTVTLTGLANGTYDVYLYEPDNVAVGSGAGNVNGVPFSHINGGFGGGTYTLGSNYHHLTGVVVTGGTMTVTSTVVSSYAGLAGMQITQQVTTVPCGHIYWTEYTAGTIRRCKFDGTNVQTLVSGLDQPYGIALDSTTDTMYWTEWGTTHTIKRAAFDGSGVATLIATGVLDRPSGIKLDLARGHMYFNQFGGPTATGGGVSAGGSGATWTGRANLDGTGVVVVQDPLSTGRTGIGVDVRGLLTDSLVLAKGRPAAPSDVLQRWDLVPSTLTTIATIADGRFMSGVDLDVANGHVYWSALNSGIFRSDLAAPPANTVNVVPPVAPPTSFVEQHRDLALDLVNGLVYWTYAPPLPGSPAGQPSQVSGIRRATLTGTGVTTILSGLDGRQPQGIAVDVIVDTTPPTVACALARGILWPPRMGMLPAGLTFSATDDQDFSPTLEVTVFSDEPVGAAPFAPDAATVGGSWCLRAERGWTGNGRVYLVVVKATDQCGNEGFGCCTAVVPKMPTAFWITQALMEATTARTSCQGSGTGDVGTYTQVSP